MLVSCCLSFQIPVLNIQMKMVPAICTFLGAIFSCTNYFRVIFTGGVGKNGSTIAVSVAVSDSGCLEQWCSFVPSLKGCFDGLKIQRGASCCQPSVAFLLWNVTLVCSVLSTLCTYIHAWMVDAPLTCCWRVGQHVVFSVAASPADDVSVLTFCLLPVFSVSSGNQCPLSSLTYWFSYHFGRDDIQEICRSAL